MNLESDAVWEEDRCYCYTLWRIWDEAIKPVMFIGLNPSTSVGNGFDNSSDDDGNVSNLSISLNCLTLNSLWLLGLNLLNLDRVFLSLSILLKFVSQSVLLWTLYITSAA